MTEEPRQDAADEATQAEQARDKQSSRWWLHPRARRVDLLVAVLLGVLGFAVVAQVRTTQEDGPLATARQEDLVQILDDLANRNERLRAEIESLTDAQRRLTRGSDTTQAALDEARRRAQILGVLAGTLPATGPGIYLDISDPDHALGADVLVDTLQELRDAGAEAVEIEGTGPDGRRQNVRVVASTSFVDTDDGVQVDGVDLAAPYRFTVIGDPDTLAGALAIPGGVLETVQLRGGVAHVQEGDELTVDALRPLEPAQYARPAPDEE